VTKTLLRKCFEVVEFDLKSIIPLKLMYLI
jgi:hypothetical protein